MTGPHDEYQWQVRKTYVGDSVVFTLVKIDGGKIRSLAYSDSAVAIATAPGWLAKFFGDTMEKRVRRAEKKAQALCLAWRNNDRKACYNKLHY